VRTTPLLGGGMSDLLTYSNNTTFPSNSQDIALPTKFSLDKQNESIV